jgi:dihydrofolate reductase
VNCPGTAAASPRSALAPGGGHGTGKDQQNRIPLTSRHVGLPIATLLIQALEEGQVGKFRYSTSMSLDGFVAGVDQGPDHPLGVGGELLHVWMRELAAWRREAGLEGGVENESTKVLEEEDVGVGALIMGRNMFGGGPGPWNDPVWNGWWGPVPPFHLPVFVLTHHARTPLECEGGTTFTFVTEGIRSALDRAAAAAGEADVAISGGADVAKQYLAAGLLDEFTIHLVPVLLGAGVRLFDQGTEPVAFDQASVITAPGVVHLTYKVRRT